MSDFLTRGFRAQLSTTMESVLRTAVFEIMKLFENNLYDHQIELAHKGEEIAQLKIKLQRAEVRLREIECRGEGERGTEVNELQKEPEDVVNASGQTSEVPEIDFEVPDDWCAPLGCETVTKQDDNVCPSVKLRSLYIPLWPVSLVKEEAVNHKIGSQQRTKGGRGFKKGSSLKERRKQNQDRSSPLGIRRPPVRDDMKNLLKDISYDYADLSGRSIGLRGGRNSTGQEQENTLKIKKEEERSTDTVQFKSKKKGEKKYSCKFCKKIFDTLFGRNVHLQSHKRCRGCKRDFPFPSFVKRHEPFCAALRTLLKKNTESIEPPKPQSCDRETRAKLIKTEEVIKEENTPSPGNPNESSIEKNGPTKKHSCALCNKKFRQRRRLKEHMRIHTGERPFACPMCPKKFHINQSLKLHLTRIHKDQGNSSETNVDLTWTKPLEVIGDIQEDVTSPNKDMSQTVNHIKVERECSPEKKAKMANNGHTL